MFVSKIRRVGNSQSILVPASLIRTLGIVDGDEVEVEVRPLGHVSFDVALMDALDDYDVVLERLAER
jgi:antitoxin component of MazEF toxin-antitoxin module